VNPLLAIIIPVYNEAENIISVLQAISQTVKTAHSIYIVYDFDEDNTLPAVKSAGSRFGNIVLLKNELHGVAGAIKTGLIRAKEPYLLVTMADLSDECSIIDKMVQKMDAGYDIVCGSRYMKGGKQIGGGLLKPLLSRFAGVSLHYLAGLPTHDATNSFKLYRKNLIGALNIESTNGFEIGIEILVKAYAAGYRITEIPSVWQDRTVGKSRFKIFKWAPHYLRWYFYGIKAGTANRFKKLREIFND